VIETLVSSFTLGLLELHRSQHASELPARCMALPKGLGPVHLPSAWA
jgi:hypothetical protein